MGRADACRRRPMSGRCCDFPRTDHELWSSALELAYVFDNQDLVGRHNKPLRAVDPCFTQIALHANQYIATVDICFGQFPVDVRRRCFDKR